MSLFVTQVKASTAQGHTDFNKIAETILIPLLAEVYGYTKLRNINSERYNCPGIDLGDETARVAFQITSTSDTEKVKEALQTFIKYKWYENYDRLIIYNLIEKENHKPSSVAVYEKIIQGKFVFDKDKDIWDFRDILKKVEHFQIEKARKIESILEANFGEKRIPPEWEVIDKVEQIVNKYTQLFVGRSEDIQKLDNFLCENSSGVILVKAGAGFGKTALLANWVNTRRRNKDCFIAYHFFNHQYSCTRSIKSAYRNLLRQLYLYYNLSYEQMPEDEEQLRIRLYNLLREPCTLENTSLIIVIDGLDEAENPFLPPFPTPLPKNVFVFASARAEEGEEPEYLRGWMDCAEAICLGRLCNETIKDWLRQAGEGKLEAFADNAYFVSQFDEIAQGFPLYIHFLTEELIQTQQQGQDVQAVLTQSPKGFGNYVEEQFKLLAQMDEIKQQQGVQKLFALLSIALGMLSADDICELTNLNEWDLANLPWQATRWFNIQLRFYSFAHPLLAQEFQCVLRHQVSSVKTELIAYCSRWQEHQSPYALRHYTDHLCEAKRWEELNALVRNEPFTATQQQHLPQEPSLVLKTTQAALLAAAETDNAAAMAEFLLVHAWQLLAQELPLYALRSGSLTRALALADLYEIERTSLWYLLLAWELKDTGKLDEAQATLEKLRQKKLVRGFSLSVGANGIRASYPEYAAYLLAYISDINKDAFKDITQRLLEGCQQITLCKTLCVHGDSITALETALAMDDGWWKIDALADIAVAQAQNGEKIAAQNTLNFILETEQSNDDKWKQIAAAQARSGDFEAASEALLKIGEQDNQVWVLGKIAIAQAQVGQKEAAKANLAIALDTARKIDNELKKANALQDVAIAQAKAGEFTSALETAQETGWECTRSNVLNSIVEVYSQAENFDGALKIVETMIAEKPNDISKHSRGLKTIAEAVALTGDFDAAWSVVAKMRSDQGDAKGRIAAIMVQRGASDTARDTLASVLKTTVWIKSPQQKQVEALGSIAQVQAKVGERDKALATFAEALTKAEKINDNGQKDSVLHTISEIQVRNNEIDAALNTAKMIESNGKRLTLLPSIAVAYGKNGDKNKAQSIFTSALEIARKVDNEIDKEYILREIAKGQAQIRDFPAALETVEENGKDFTRPQILAVIAQMKAQEGKINEAQNDFTVAVEEARKLGSESSWTLRTISEAQASIQSEEFFIAALETARIIEYPKEKVKAMQEIARVQFQSGQFSDALKTLQEIQSEAEGEQAVELLVIRAESQAKTEAKEASQDTYTKSIELVHKIQDDAIKAELLETVAKSQAKSSFGTLAIRTTDRILMNRNKHLLNVAKVLAEVGDRENFKHLLIPCAYYWDAAYEICGHLALLYPEQAAAVAKVVNEFH